jgi:hypothetical protein
VPRASPRCQPAVDVPSALSHRTQIVSFSELVVTMWEGGHQWTRTMLTGNRRRIARAIERSSLPGRRPDHRYGALHPKWTKLAVEPPVVDDTEASTPTSIVGVDPAARVIRDVRHEQVPGSRPYRSRCGVRAFGWYAATPCRRTLWSAPATGHELAGAGEPPSVHFSNLPAGKTNQCPSAQSTRTCSMGPSVDSSTNRSAMATNAVQSSSGHIVNAKRPFLKFARLASLTCRGILFASRFRACRPLTSISVLLLAE